MDNQQLQEIEKKVFYAISEAQTSLVEVQNQLNISSSQLNTALDSMGSKGLALKHINHDVTQDFQSFDIESIREFLAQNQICKTLHYKYQTNSTNELVKNPNTIALSEFQKSGYGRAQKRWLSPLARGIPISIHHVFNLPLQKLTGLSLAIGYALAKTLNQYSNKQFKIKWPNDIYGERGKVAGILIQAKPISAEKTSVILGIGINWNLTAQQLDHANYPCMNANVSAISKTKFIMNLIKTLEKTYLNFENEGLKKIMTHWSQFDFLSKSEIQIQDNETIHKGQNLGITESGALKVLIKGKIKEFVNGEVSVRKVDL